MRVDCPGNGPIHFEDRKISDVAKLFALAPGFNLAPHEIRKFIFDLRYAWARTRQCESTVIFKTCDWLESIVYDNQAALMENITSRFPNLNAKETLSDWLLTVSEIHKIAESRDICSWTMASLPGEAAIFIKPLFAVVRKAQAIHKKKAFPEACFASLETASEAEQIRFINLVVDTYSDERY